MVVCCVTGLTAGSGTDDKVRAMLVAESRKQCDTTPTKRIVRE